MLYIHPVLQLTALVLALYALALAWPRFVSLHLGRKKLFNRRRHVLVGQASLILMLLGMAGGALMVRLYWRRWFATGEHAWVALIMLPLLLWGLGSGLYLAGSPRPRRWLPALHGLGNLVLLGLGLWQIHEGAEVIEHFVRGG